ncbi:MAG TPA: magnesium transporter, partial [Salinivirgaceae bacterium]|nr:magnesium transporter [Salinivirgaceae bacterium]
MVEQITDFHELIENKEWKTLKIELTQFDAFQIAEFIEELDEDDDIIMFRLLSREQAKETFQHLPHSKQERIVDGLAKNVRMISSLLNDLDPDDRTAFLEELPGTITQRLIQLLSPEERKIATKLLGYPEESIGRLMTPEYVAIKEYYTVDQAL